MKIVSVLWTIVLSLFMSLSACTKSTPSTDENDESGSQASANGVDQDSDEEADAGTGHHGPSITLGTTDIGTFSVRAGRDEGEITPGGDAPIDVWVDGDYESITAVRFWIGTEDARGSIKVRADIEDPNTPNHWHTHAIVPDPLPEGAMLWVEIETAEGKQTGSYDLHIGHSH